MSSEFNCCSVWEKFQKCKNFHSTVATKNDTEKSYRFYEGDQWYGIECDQMLPVYNFISPLVNYKVSMIAMNSMQINYSVIGKNERLSKIATLLNVKASCTWERQKMDTKCWDIIRSAAIAGDSYIYFYDNNLNSQIIEKTDIYFADEQQPDIQRQPYIIITERRPVEKIIEEAIKNGIPDEEISKIKSDSNLENVVSTENSKKEVETDKGKCTSLLYLQLDSNGSLHFCRCTEHVIYQPEQIIEDYGCYPIASLVINRKKGTARGRGEVLPLINNQIEVNKTLARRVLNAKLNALPKLIYDSDKIQNPSSLGEAGTAIEVEGGMVEDVKNAITYLTPPGITGEVINLTSEMMSVTRDLAGAGDAALGNIDPTQASGTAIIAVRDQASIPLNEPTAAFRQFVEDIAIIWMNTERVYNPETLKLEDGSIVKPDELKDLNLTVRIDVCPKNPFSKYALERSLESLFIGGHISFEEYVNALDDESSVPKAKLQEILSKRTSEVENIEPDPNMTSGTLEQLHSEISDKQNSYSGNIEELAAMVDAKRKEVI